jgi:hypothetical protein
MPAKIVNPQPTYRRAQLVPPMRGPIEHRADSIREALGKFTAAAVPVARTRCPTPTAS